MPGRFLRTTLYVAWLLTAVVAVDGVLWWRWRGAVAGQVVAPAPVPPPLDTETSRLVGHIRPPGERGRGFGRFARTKAPGVIRVGCFGDSFTWGDEVIDGNDYPAWLQTLLDADGGPRVEVLNFGSTGWGFHQTALLWERIGRDYDLDVIVVWPFRFWTARDLGFATRWHSPAPATTFHARYVLAGSDLALVPPLGDDPATQFDAYHRWLPPLRYLRFDRAPPPFLAALLPEGRTIANPFYYVDASPWGEAAETYRRLLARMVGSGARVLVADTGPMAFAPLARAAGAEVVPLERGRSFVHRAPFVHQSPFGNRLVAAQLRAAIRRDPAPIVAPETTPLEPGPPPIALAEGPLTLSVEVGGRRIASAWTYRAGTRALERLETLGPDAGLLLVSADGDTAGGLWLPVPRRAGGGAVTLRLDGRDYPVGVTSEIATPGIEGFDPCAADAIRALLLLAEAVTCRVPQAMTMARAAGRRATLLVRGTPLVDLVTDGSGRRITLVPHGAFHRLRGDGDVAPDWETLPEDDVVSLRLAATTGATTRVPLARWRMRPLHSGG